MAILVKIYFIKDNSQSIKELNNNIKKNSTQIIASNTLSLQSKKFATKKLKNLTMVSEQCKERTLDFSNQVENIHQVLIQALEFELKNGRTERELLAYSSQYKTFYDRYDALLLQAKINVEKEKYSYTNSVDILSDWNGLSVISGFSSLSTPIIVQGLKAFEGKSNGLTMNLELNNSINKSDIYNLLNNNENFNTYLESPLGISRSPVISPSILFVLTAKQLNINEFQQAVALQSFTVNDLAIAIMNNMPNEYLELLIPRTKSIEDFPIIAQGSYDSYKNLADLAASQHNVKLLALLDSYGITGTNEEGIITALDIAIMNLPIEAEAYQNVESFPDKYLDTLSYLNRKGYRAHGMTFQNDNETVVLFKAPNRRNFQISKILEPKLRDYLYQIELIDSSYNILQLSPDGSLVSNAIETMEIRKNALNDKSKSCEIIRKELLAEEGFADSHETYGLINDIRKSEEYIAEKLHEIDPVLVNLWRDSNATSTVSLERDSNFINLLQEGKYQQALDYSASKPLTTQETDTLLISLIQNIEDIIPIWNARVSPKPPSSLLAFKYLDAEKWKLLMTEGFNFSIKDEFENDIFLPAALNSPKVISFLLDNGFTPEFERSGVDVLDLLLDESYEKGQLHPSLTEILAEIKSLEPSHYSRVARIKKFYPSEYEKLIKLNKHFELSAEVKINRFRFSIRY
jgi:hypothetical protein